MKLLTVTIPCYNSQDYMRHCVETLLPGGEEVEILIVDDGSTDKTGEIAEEYAEKYPGIVRVIHQENGGHGEAVNTGIRNASGKYLKIVDSDDWVDGPSYEKILELLRQVVADGQNLDMLISNFVYEKVGVKRKKLMNYRKAIPIGTFFSWEDVKNFKLWQYILMHSVIYRTQLLRDCGLELPKHTFYVDNIYVYQPLPYVKTMYYLDVNFYRYFIGRSDQSVNEKVMLGRLDQQIRVNKIMYDSYDLSKMENPHLRDYMYQYLMIITAITTVLLIRGETKENLALKKELWQYMKAQNPKMYHHMRHELLVGRLLHMPGKTGRDCIIWCYKIAQKIFGFNS